MFKKNEATRLGEVLLNKGLISSEQLNHAIKEQASRRKTLDPNDQSSLESTSLGEVLIALGYIDRLQLKRGLNWQLKLRKMTIAMALCAPFMSLSTGAAAAIAKTVSPIPATIEAENYTTMLGIAVETTTDVGGGKNIGNFTAGDWVSYTNTAISIPTSGSYVISYRVASLRGDGSFTLNDVVGTAVTVIDTVNVPKTDGWQNWVTVQHTVYLTAGLHYFNMQAVTSGANVNWFKIEQAPAASSAASVTSSSKSSAASSTAVSSTPAVSSSKSSAASSSAPAAVSSSKASVASSVSSAASSAAPVSNLPLKIEAESFSKMLGVEAQTTSDTDGGSNVGWIDPGDWMAYENSVVNIPTTGQYIVSYRVASGGGGGSFSLYEVANSSVYDTVTVSDTGDWQKWVTIQRAVVLTAGKHTFGIKSLSGGFNLNWFKIEAVGSTSSSTSSSTATTTSSSSSSKPAVSSSSLSSSSTSNSSVASSTSTGSAVTTAVAGPVGMNWTPPTGRLDGTPLDITEIGGYEIRYKLANDADYTYISINDAWTTQYNFAWLEGTYVFQVAAFDKNGVYSNFVDVVKN